MKKVGIIMGSDSDLPVVEKAFAVLREYNVPFEAHVYSAHRTPAEAKAFAENARANGFGVIIAAAGMAAHLPVLWLLQQLFPSSVFPSAPRLSADWTHFCPQFRCPPASPSQLLLLTVLQTQPGWQCRLSLSAMMLLQQSLTMQEKQTWKKYWQKTRLLTRNLPPNK